MKNIFKKSAKDLSKRIRHPLIIAVAITLLLVGGAVFATIQLNRVSTKQGLPSTDSNTQKEKAAEPKSTTSSSSTSPVTSQSSQPELPTTQTSQAPASQKSSPPSNAVCTQAISDIYVRHNNEIAAEYAYHQDILSQLKVEYYGDADPNLQPYNPEYQQAIQEENDRWTQATTLINNTSSADMAAIQC